MNSKDPLVSINIPVYKCEKYVLRCLESVKAQTYKNLEIILVNDQTPDDSMSVVSQFVSENSDINIKIITLTVNSGLSVVRNTGIGNSAGEYIFFLDSDDEITSDCIEKLVRKALDTDAQMTIGQNRWINTFDNTTKDYGFPTLAAKKDYDNPLEIFETYSNGGFPASSWNKLIKKSLIIEKQIYFVPGLYAQDELWFFHLLLKINTISIIDDITYLYYLHGESVIFNRKKKNFENFITILQYFSNSFQQEERPAFKKLIKQKIILFKEMVLIMQWKALKDREYLEENIKRMKKLTGLTFTEYFSSEFSLALKKKAFFQNLPSALSARFFIWRFER